MSYVSAPRALVFFGLLFLVGSCKIQPKEDLIIRPVVSTAFYERSANRLEEILAEDTANVEFIRLQLTYYDKLNWPTSAEVSVARARDVLPLDPLVARMYADFYLTHNQFSDLGGLFDEMDSTFAGQQWMDRYKVLTYLEMGEPETAVEVLERMLLTSEMDSELSLWAGKAYLEAGDTASAFLHLREAKDNYSLDPEYLQVYLPLALEQKKGNEVILLAEKYLFEREASAEMRLFLSSSLYEADAKTLAKDQLRQSVNREGLILLSNWYEQERQWDSAHYCIDRVLLADSEDIEALLRKGDIDQSRGWLARASRYYDQVLDIDSTHVGALERQDLINRKIAYLRRIREARRERPVLDLNSKKEVN